MSSPEFGKITFIKRPVTRLITKPGNKVHVKFNVQTRPRYSVRNYWDSQTSDCCHCDNKSNTWFGIGALIGAVGGLLAKIFGGKKQAKQTVAPDNTRQQYIPPKQEPTKKPVVQDNNNNNKVKDENTTTEGKQKDENNVKPDENAKKPLTTATGGRSPSGWYRVKADGKSEISGLTVRELKNAEAKGGQSQKTAAKYVLDKVLGTKLEQLNPNQRAQLLNEIIKKNPSVFDGQGRLKTDATVEKLDVPSKDWIEKNITGIKVESQAQNGINKVKVDKEPKGQRTILGDNGYYAVITTDKNGKKSAKFYAPSENAQVYNNKMGKMEKSRGRNITGPSFENHCPNIYKQVMAELKK